MTLGIELEREDDGRWLAEAPALAGVMCYGETRDDAVARVQRLALRVIADRDRPTTWGADTVQVSASPSGSTNGVPS